MRERQDIPRALQRLATCQSGMLTREQVLGHGLSQNVLTRLVESGSWQRISPGLYAVHPMTPSWEALAWGGVLLGGDRARLGPEASGHLHGVLDEAPDPIDVLVPADRLVRNRGHWRFVRERPAVRSDRSFGTPPRLSVDDAILDLTDRMPPGQAVSMVSVAVQSRLTTADRLRRRLDRRSRHAHRSLMVELLADVAEGAESPLEVRYVRTVERPHGLPEGDRQNSHRGLPHCRDVKYVRFCLVVELDGRDAHLGKGRFRDMRRDNLHALLDELTLRFGWFDVSDRPCVVAYQVYLVLVKYGYAAPFVRCAFCRDVPEMELAIA